VFQTKGIRKKIAEFLGRHLSRYKPKVNRAIRPASVFNEAKSVFICMPFDDEQFQKALLWADNFKGKYPHLEMTLLVIKRHRSLAAAIKSKKVLSLTEEDGDFLKLPGNNLIRRIRRAKYDLAVDLNHGGTLFSSILCSISGAEVRIGFTGEWSDYFLNYSVTPRSRQSISGSYEALANYLT